MVLRILALSIFIHTVVASPAFSAVQRVSATAPGPAHDGTTWETAYLTVQGAVNSAQTDDEIWVVAGTYTENITVTGRLSLFGGFAGTETERVQRNSKANPTILAAASAGPVVIVRGSQPVIVDGFTIRNGSGSPAGGIVCDTTEAKISNNIVTGNAVGGIAVVNGGDPVLNGNTISANTAFGISVEAASRATIRGNTVRATLAPASGLAGGIVVETGADVTIVNNVVNGNKVAGIVCAGTGLVANNTVVRNLAVGLDVTGSTAMFANNIVAFHSFGIRSNAARPDLRRNCLFRCSTATYDGFSIPADEDTSLLADPYFVSLPAEDFHIQPESRCRDAGDGSVAAGIWTDMDAEPRVQGGAVDIGADESDGTRRAGYVQYVNGTAGADYNNGLSWAKAKKSIASAIQAARTAGSGEVWVVGGTYGIVTLYDGIHMYGGFTGTETELTQRDLLRQGTILDGETLNTIVRATDVCDATLDGFVLTRGAHYASTSDPGRGGAVALQNSTVTFRNNNFRDNAASEGAAIGITGGSPFILKNVFSRNTAGKGGAVFCAGGATPIVSDNVFRLNVSSSGGAICAADGSPVITRNTFFGNGSTTAGSDPNDTSKGGAILVSGSLPATITNNKFAVNRSAYGGAIHASAPGSTIANNLFTGNSAAWNGGALFANDTSILVANNTFVDNTAVEGGAVAGGPALATLVNNATVNNSSGIFLAAGPGVSVVLRNNDVFGNRAYDYKGLTDPTGSDGNISADPAFANLQYGLLRVQPNSPLVDAGDSAVVSADWTALDGAVRTQGARVDVGAYESDGTQPSAEPPVIRIRPDGSDANDGHDWSHARRSVQGAIEALTGIGGEVWAAAGVYPENIAIGPFTYLYGGFAGTEARRSERDVIGNLSVLDGQGKGTAVSARGASYGTVDGFVIRNGKATQSAGYPAPFLFRTGGGGVFLVDSDISITGNTISGNTANAGAGVCVNGHRPVIDRNRFLGNSAVPDTDENYGGGVLTVNSTAIITNNLIKANAAPFGAGAFLADGAILANNTLIENKGTGAIASMRPTIFTTPPASVVNNIVAFNDTGLFARPVSALALRHNLVFGNRYANYGGIPNATGTDGNISADPVFLDAANGEYRLSPGSPAINAGDDFAVAGDRDLGGEARRVGRHIDIGAFESSVALGLPHAIRALRISGGLAGAADTDVEWLDIFQADNGAMLTLTDALRIARQTMGLE